MKKNECLDIWNNKKKQIEKMDTTIIPRQRDVYWVEFGENIGNELSDNIEEDTIHPGVVMSKNSYNKSETVLIAPLSSLSNRGLENKSLLRCHYKLKAEKYNYLSKDCILKLDQMRCLSTKRLNRKIGFIHSDDWNKIELRIQTLFNLK